MERGLKEVKELVKQRPGLPAGASHAGPEGVRWRQSSVARE